MDSLKSITVTILLSLVISIILIVISIIVLGCQQDTDPVKNGIILFGNYFGGITTLTASIVATSIYKHWRIQIDYAQKLKLFEILLDDIHKIEQEIHWLKSQKSIFQNLLHITKIRKNHLKTIQDEEKLKEIIATEINDLNKCFLYYSDIQNTYTKLELLYNESSTSKLHNTIKRLLNLIQDFQSSYSAISYHETLKSKLDLNDKDWLIFACEISYIYFKMKDSIQFNSYEIEDSLQKFKDACINVRIEIMNLKKSK